MISVTFSMSQVTLKSPCLRSMQMEHKEGNAPVEGVAEPQATPADSDSHSKPPNAEDGAQKAQQTREYIAHRNGSTSAKVEGKQAGSSSKPDTNDTELQRRKAALLQQVRLCQSPGHPSMPVKWAWHVSFQDK